MDESVIREFNEGRVAAGDERWKGMLEGATTTLKQIQEIINSAATPEQAIDTINTITQQFAMDMILISISQISEEAKGHNAG